MIAYDFGTFVMFSIFEYVILVFPKHSNFRGFFEVIHKKIMQIGKSRTSEELRRFKRPQKTYKLEEFYLQVLVYLGFW